MPEVTQETFQQQFARLSSLRNRALGKGILDTRPLSPAEAADMHRLQRAVDSELNAGAGFTNVSQYAALAALTAPK